MRLLVATARTQGQRSNDFDYCIDGELVRLSTVCGRSQDDPDDDCGCGRAWVGLDSNKATTTAEVVEIDLTYTLFREAIRASLKQAGWNPDAAEDVARTLDNIVYDLPIGAVVERRLNEIRVRR